MENFIFKSFTIKNLALIFSVAFLSSYGIQSFAKESSDAEEHEHSHKTDDSGLAPHTENTVHQYSPTIALLNSIYEGDITPQQMIQQGNIGLGTVNQLAGELIAVDGIVFTIDAEGGIKKAPNNLKSPNMTMINFQPKQTIELKNVSSLEDLNTALNKYRTSKNSFYAYKIKGEFAYLKMASAHKVENEDVSLFEYLDTRVMYTRENIKGTLVGLFTPNYLANIVIPGMHLHFLSDDIKLGGHLEDIRFNNLSVEVQEVNQVNLQLPKVDKFRTKELKNVQPPKATASKPVAKVEKVQGSDFALTKKWEVAGFKMPESVFASADHPWLYVSNVNGAEPGFISRVAKDGTIDKLEWVTGLISPTGSDLYQNKLYVADAKQLHAIDVSTGKITESFGADASVSLNDVAIDQRTGEVYVSDVPGGKVYRLKDGKLSAWFESSEIPYPNGVLVQGNSLIVANYALKNGEGLMRKQWKPDDFGTLYKVDLATKSQSTISSSVKKGVYDGVVEFNDVLMASSNPTGQILTFDGDNSHLIDASESGLADINTDGKIIYAPYIFNNKLTAFEPIAWDRVTTKQEYLDKGADNYYGDAGGKSIATHDGIIKGIFGGMQLEGTWDWKGEYFCRTSTLGTMDLGADCIQIDVTEDKMRLVLNKGEGPSVVYDKKAKNDEITILSTFKIKSDKIDLYKKEMLGNQDVVRKESGTVEMKLFQDKNDPTTFLVFGRNAGAVALESHSENVEDRGIADRVKPALAEAPKTLFLINQAPLLTQDVEIYNVEEDDVLLFFMFDVKETHRDALLERLRIHTKLTRQEEGNIRFDFYRLKGSENTIVLQQQWQNDAAGDFHREQDYTKVTDKMMIEAIGNSKQQGYFVNQIDKKKVNEQAINSKTDVNKEENTMIQMIGQFQMKTEGRAKFKDAMLEVVKGTLKEPGALAIRMFEDTNNPDLLFGYERFKDFSAVEYHRKQSYELDLMEVASTSLSAPPVAYVFGPALAEEVRAPDERKVDASELYVVALFDIKPDQFDRVVAQYKKQIPNVRKHEGSISFNAYSVLDTPNKLVVVEWWKSAEVARQFSTTDPLSIETGKILMESLEGPIPGYLHELREVNP